MSGLALMGRLVLAASVSLGAAPAPPASRPGSPPASASASPPPSPPARQFPFDGAVAAIFRARCVRCHGPDEAANDLRLDSYAAVRRGGASGPVVIPGDGAASLLLQKVLRRDRPYMPPRERLPAGEIAALRAWIRAGALP